jgi:hypothetical protein
VLFLRIPDTAKSYLRFRPPYRFLFFLVLAATLMGTPSQAADKNKLTIANQSGDDAAIRVMGPREWLIEVPNGQERTFLLPNGNYTYLTRYGQDPNYRYSRGTPFQIEKSQIGFTEATLTLISAPGPGPSDPALAEQFNRPIASPPETPAEGKPPAAAEKPTPGSKTLVKDKSGEEFILHRVTGGETLPSISQYYSGEADYWPEIAKYNSSVDPLRLKPGTTVKIPVYLALIHKTPPEAKPAPPSPKPPKKSPPKPLTAPPPGLPKPPEGGFGPK